MLSDRARGTPFTDPAPKSTAPYWLRPRNDAHEAQHRELMARLEQLHRVQRGHSE